MNKRYYELKNEIEAIETTLDCISEEIILIEDAIDDDLYEEDEMKEEIDEIKKLNDIIKYLRKLRDKYYLWSLEETFRDEE